MDHLEPFALKREIGLRLQSMVNAGPAVLMRLLWLELQLPPDTYLFIARQINSL